MQVKDLKIGECALIKGASGDKYEFIRLGEREHVERHLNNTQWIRLYDDIALPQYYDRFLTLEVIDQFEESIDIQSSILCTCDFYSVVLRSGCKCGGK